MDHFEMVEKLREKANVSYEDAKNALEMSQWDLLDALVYLEKEGKVLNDSAASFSTRQEPREMPKPREERAGFFKRLIDLIFRIINSMSRIDMKVSKKNDVVLTVPLLALALMALFGFWFLVPVMIIGLFFGYTYRFQGPGVADGVNRVMDKAASVANDIKTGVQDADNTPR